jgi:hypothetical protein
MHEFTTATTSRATRASGLETRLTLPVLRCGSASAVDHIDRKFVIEEFGQQCKVLTRFDGTSIRYSAFEMVYVEGVGRSPVTSVGKFIGRSP